ncbi:hypothetical protein QT981_10330, partial [Microcoleus sp. herbarium13]
SSATPDANPANNNGSAPGATVTTALTPTPTPTPAPSPLNQPPVANNANAVVAPGSTVPLPGLGGSDPDGTVASYKIDTLP